MPDPKGYTCLISFIWNFGTGKISLSWQKVDQCLPGVEDGLGTDKNIWAN